MMRNKRRGAQAIETALVTIFGIVPLMAGVIDYGAYLSQYVQMVNCVKQGARAGSLAPADEGNSATIAQNVADEAAANANLFIQPTFDATVTVVDLDGVALTPADSLITVTGRAQYNSFFGPVTFFVVPTTIQVQAVMRVDDA